mmetsp:Transcript_5255/g.17703  ORF Transcript_5255/g.17703 Transcript_5255/m.17703 type:complete len:362 (+) Transcript_5255:633-1718(+)
MRGRSSSVDTTSSLLRPVRGYVLYKLSAKEDPMDVYSLRRLTEEAQRMGVELTVHAPESFDLLVTRDDRKSVRVDGVLRPLPDFLIPRMGSATTYFALAVIRHFERLGVVVLNSSQSVETVKDKLWSLQVLAESNLPIAKTLLVKQPIDKSFVAEAMGYPLIMKVLSGSHGEGVFLVESEGQLQDMLTLVSANAASGGAHLNLILQEFIASSHGRDLRVITVGGRAIGAMMRRATDGSFKANITRGGVGLPYELNPEIEWLATETARVVGLDISGIDLLFDGEHFRICEANSSPGFEGFEKYTGINVAAQILEFACVRAGRIDMLPSHKAPVPAPGAATPEEGLPVFESGKPPPTPLAPED